MGPGRVRDDAVVAAFAGRGVPGSFAFAFASAASGAGVPQGVRGRCGGAFMIVCT